MIIDFHAHLAPGLREEMIQSGIDKVVLLMPASGRIYTPSGQVRRTNPKEHLQANERVLEAASQHSNLIPFAWLDYRVPRAGEMLREYVQRGCKGIKLHPVVDHYSLLDPRLAPLLETAAQLNIPIMVHTGWRPYGSVWDVGTLAERYPAIQFVVGHMKEEWGVNRRLSHIEVAERHPNLWLECSYVEHPRRVGEAVNRLGADRIMYGSDWPLGGGHMSWDLTKVTCAPISEGDKAKILGENARRLLGL